MPRGDDHFATLETLLGAERTEERRRHVELLNNSQRSAIVERGLGLLDLEPRDERWGLGGRLIVEFRRDTSVPNTFRSGAPVELRALGEHDGEPVHAIVSRKRGSRLDLAFERPPPSFVTSGRSWVTLAPNDATHRHCVDALHQISKQRDHADVLLGYRPPEFRDETLAADESLNPEQRSALLLAAGAQNFCMIHGPPGTGKSTVLGHLTAHAVSTGERVLATAASNAAVDHLLEVCLDHGLRAIRVGHPARVLPRLVEHTLDVRVENHPATEQARVLLDDAHALKGYARKQRSQGRSRDRFKNARNASQEAGELFRRARELERLAVRDELSGADVICATCTAVRGHVLRGESFDLAVIDEATQAIEPLTLIPWLAAKRVVLAGDHRQLPPTVLSSEAEAGGLGVSLFERLLEDSPEVASAMLQEQYRMHDTIMRFPSEQLYDGKLRAHASVASRGLGSKSAALDTPPVLFLDTAGRGLDEELGNSTESLRNPGEAQLVATRVAELLEHGLHAEQVGVITPYTAQVARLRELLEAVVEDPESLEIDTVDGFQGREKDIIIVSMVRSNTDGVLGFLTDIRRMNVAMTRAKRHLFVVGDSGTLANHPFYEAFIEYVQTHDGYRTVWEWPAELDGF